MKRVKRFNEVYATRDMDPIGDEQLIRAIIDELEMSTDIDNVSMDEARKALTYNGEDYTITVVKSIVGNAPDVRLGKPNMTTLEMLGAGSSNRLFIKDEFASGVLNILYSMYHKKKRAGFKKSDSEFAKEKKDLLAKLRSKKK